MRARLAKFNTLEDIPKVMVEVATESTAKSEMHSKEKRNLLEGVRTAQDPIVKKAFQIQLQTHRRRQREQKENHKLLEGARANDWSFTKRAKIPTRAAIPASING